MVDDNNFNQAHLPSLTQKRYLFLQSETSFLVVYGAIDEKTNLYKVVRVNPTLLIRTDEKAKAEKEANLLAEKQDSFPLINRV